MRPDGVLLLLLGLIFWSISTFGSYAGQLADSWGSLLITAQPWLNYSGTELFFVTAAQVLFLREACAAGRRGWRKPRQFLPALAGLLIGPVFRNLQIQWPRISWRKYSATTRSKG